MRPFRSFAEFEREYIRPGQRLGLTIEDMVQDSPFEAEFDFDKDPLDDPDDDDE